MPAHDMRVPTNTNVAVGDFARHNTFADAVAAFSMGEGVQAKLIRVGDHTHLCIPKFNRHTITPGP